jgi:hypothetical protein
MGHSSPEITAQTYDHSGVEDFGEQFDRALSFGVGQPIHADAMQPTGGSKEEAPGADAFECDSEGFKSGRQDLNPRPLGPEGPQGDPHGVVPGHLASYPIDNTGVGGEAGSHPMAPVPPVEPPFGAYVVQATSGPLLTVAEIAARLRVSRATVDCSLAGGAHP